MLSIVASAALLACVIPCGPSWADDAEEGVDEDGLTRTSFTTGTSLLGRVARAGIGAGTEVDVRMKSWKQLKWENIVRQKTDIGCGAASLATILSFYFDFPTDELEMVDALYTEAVKDYTDPNNPPPSDIRSIGFNLRHIRNVAKRGGLVAAAFEVALEDIEKVKIPVITRVTIKGYDHFAVFRGASGGRVYLADPAFGNTSYRLDQFARIWSGLMMGFVRRGEAMPEEHLLIVDREDERQMSWKNLMRIVVQEPIELSFDAGPRIVDIPLVAAPIEGLQSALPSYKEGRYEFSPDLSF